MSGNSVPDSVSVQRQHFHTRHHYGEKDGAAERISGKPIDGPLHPIARVNAYCNFKISDVFGLPGRWTVPLKSA